MYGEENTFGHPHEDVLRRLEDKQCKIYRTDKMGEIILEVNKRGNIKIKTTIEQE